MLRHIPQQLHPRILHRRVWIQPLGDGMGDHGLALFLQQLDQALLLGDQGVDLGGFAVEEGGYKWLLFDWRNRNWKRA